PGSIPVAQELVSAIAMSPDSQLIATAGRDRILLWDAASGNHRNRIEKKMGQVMNLAFTPDGATLISGSETDGKIHIWDVATGTQRQLLDARNFLLRTIALSHDGKFVAAGTCLNTVRVWNLATGQELLADYAGHDARVNSVAYSPDGSLLPSAGE